jgi:hypothetical protein
MANWFEDLTKTMVNDNLTRRQAIGRIAGVVAGATIVTWLPDQALAKHVPWKKQCPNGGCGCTCGFENCFGNPNTNCYCFESIEGKGACACDSYCSQVSMCPSTSHCKKGYVCITNNGCTGCSSSYGICIQKCAGKYKNCKLGSSHAGLTAAHRSH